MLYLISTTHNYNVFTDPTLDVKTNLGVLTETLDSWKRNNPEGVFNFVSSWFVYGNGYTPDDPAYEGSECNPRGFYSITKRCAEQLVKSFAETFDMKYRILRLCNIVGPGDKPSKQKNALQFLINEMKVGNPIEIYEGGDFYRTYMHVADCAAALRLVMEKGNLNTVYNIGLDHPLHFGTTIKYCHEVLRSGSLITYIEQKEFHKKVQAKSFAMNCDKLYGLGFEPKYETYEMLTSLLK
jgi:nucleoside-diphosphate-sugar epimerase